VPSDVTAPAHDARGIPAFATFTRNTLRLAVAAAKRSFDDRGGVMYALQSGTRRRAFLRVAAVAIGFAISGPLAAADVIKIGLVTALSGQSAKAGEAITRGLTIAIDEINAKGGVLGGRKFELVRRDDEANPAKGQTAARELLFKEKVAVLFGGLDSPVALAIVPIVNQEKVPFMDPWAAGTPITRNGANPNFVFRVSAVDELVDRAMLQYAQTHYKSKTPGVIVVNNPWGESNQKGLVAALEAKGVKAAGVEKFEPNDVDVTPQLSRLRSAGADSLMLVGNVGPSAQVVKSLDRMGWKVPIVSHWGPAGGRFTELAGPNAKDVVFVQTYSFFGKQSPTGERVLAALKKKYPDIKGPGDATPAVGIANAYDAMHLVAMAIEKAGSTNGDAIRQGFYKIDSYDGLIKKYNKPFTPDNHDAIGENDYIWTRFIGQEILPVEMAAKQ
jgi:branched-chain amino acid transport system substrate-binding protein